MHDQNVDEVFPWSWTEKVCILIISEWLVIDNQAMISITICGCRIWLTFIRLTHTCILGEFFFININSANIMQNQTILGPQKIYWFWLKVCENNSEYMYLQNMFVTWTNPSMNKTYRKTLTANDKTMKN